MSGGYDDGYRECPCFWGRDPGSLVQLLRRYLPSMNGLKVLDAGCGEGKNAAFFARHGARVDAFDISPVAIANALAAWPEAAETFSVRDITGLELSEESYDVVIAYGLLHCLPSKSVAFATLSKLQRATKSQGWTVVCAFNDRIRDLSAHPGFSPTFLSHLELCAHFRGFAVCHASDEDLHETHPHNRIPHCHSLTRILARKL